MVNDFIIVDFSPNNYKGLNPVFKNFKNLLHPAPAEWFDLNQEEKKYFHPIHVYF